MAIDFSLNQLLDEHRCYDLLVDVLHPDGLGCPHGHCMEQAHVHKRKRAPILVYRCGICGRSFNLFTNTVLQGTRYTVVQVVELLRGIAQGETTSRLAPEMGVDRKWLLGWRHKLQKFAMEALCKEPLPDAVVESDEMYQNSGEKRRPAPRPCRPAPTASQ